MDADTAHRLKLFMRAEVDKVLKHAVHAPASMPTADGMSDLCIHLVTVFAEQEAGNVSKS